MRPTGGDLRSMVGICYAEGCGNLIHARGLCCTHYMRMRAKGTIQRMTQSREGVCKEPDCDKPIRAKGWCATHYQRFYMRRYKFMYPVR